MALQIRKLGDPILREKCLEVPRVDSEIMKLVDAMQESLEFSPNGIGLAATQVGSLKKLFVYDIGHGLRCILNPEMVDADDERFKGESCLSLPGISVQVPRFEKVKMTCSTLSGHELTIEADGFMSQMLQHEYDHLNGILIIDRCDEEERKRALAEYHEIHLLEGFGGA
ncbi:MAG: peptide deformylase [Actinobacteria bacterium]|nr:peptide deformylase [Actinomycetota bacterium]